MEKLTLYRQAIKNLINEYAALSPSRGDVTTQVIFDDEHGHYQLIFVGWERGLRVYGAVIHIDLIGTKAWLQYNGTELDLAQELMEKGIAREDIVIGFKPVSVRKYTGYAVA
jgi:hypothetical protein